MDIRSKFEAWFTIEDGVHFDEDGDEYITTVEHKAYTESKLTQYAWEGYQQGVKEMRAQQVTDFGQLQSALESIDKLKAENERLREALAACKTISGESQDTMNGMDTQLCEIWYKSDTALKEAK